MKMSFVPSAESVDRLLEKYYEEKKKMAKKHRAPSVNEIDEDDEADFAEEGGSAFSELMSMTGLENVKETVSRQVNYHKIMKMREKAGRKSPKRLLHMLLTGNPGTGKTTVARLIGRIYKEAGLLSSGHMVEANRASLVGQWIGESEKRTTELLGAAKGGVLFIDEIYSLSQKEGGETYTRDFGVKVIDTLLPVLSDPNSDIMIIGAGYASNVRDFLQTNPGLVSRFPLVVDFADFSVDELRKIAIDELRRYDFSLSEEADAKFIQLLRRCMAVKNHGNARLAITIVHNHLMPNFCDRMVAKSALEKSDLAQTDIITCEDVPSFETLFPLDRSAGAHLGFIR